MLGKKFSVYDSQIWCQQGRAFVLNLATPPGSGRGGGGGGGGLQYENKMELLSQANLDVSHALFVPLSWSAPGSGFTSLLFDVQLK